MFWAPKPRVSEWVPDQPTTWNNEDHFWTRCPGGQWACTHQLIFIHEGLGSRTQCAWCVFVIWRTRSPMGTKHTQDLDTARTLWNYPGGSVRHVYNHLGVCLLSVLLSLLILARSQVKDGDAPLIWLLLFPFHHFEKSQDKAVPSTLVTTATSVQWCDFVMTWTHFEYIPPRVLIWEYMCSLTASARKRTVSWSWYIELREKTYPMQNENTGSNDTGTDGAWKQR